MTLADRIAAIEARANAARYKCGLPADMACKPDKQALINASDALDSCTEPDLAAEFAAVRAPLEQRIKELEAQVAYLKAGLETIEKLTRCEDGHTAGGTEAAMLIAETTCRPLDRLHERINELEAANASLRRVVIKHFVGESDSHFFTSCGLCGGRWMKNYTAKHRPECALAGAPEREEK
jgi:BMFP domain-containing protein YqiC